MPHGFLPASHPVTYLKDYSQEEPFLPQLFGTFSISAEYTRETNNYTKNKTQIGIKLENESICSMIKIFLASETGIHQTN